MANLDTNPSIVGRDFSGGLNLLLEEHQVAANQAAILDNLVVVTGGLRTRPAIAAALATVQAGKSILGLGFFRKSDGTRKVIAVANNAGDTAAKITTYTWNGTALSAATTLTLTGGGALDLTAGAFVQMQQYADEVYFVNGSNAVHIHTLGTTVADPVTVPTAPTVVPTVVQTNNPFTNLSTNGGGTQDWTATSSADFGEATASAMVDTAEGSVICKVQATTITADAYIYREDAAARNVDRSRYLTIQGVSDTASRQVFIQFGIAGSPDTYANAVWRSNLEFPCFFPTANKWQTFAFDLSTISETDRQSIRWVRFIRKASNLKSESTEVIFRFKSLGHSGGLLGEYDYTYTYFNTTTGVESALPRNATTNELLVTRISFSNPEFLSASLTVTGTALSGGEPAKIRVYRRGGTRTDFYRVNQVANPGASTTTTADPWPDTWLGRSSGNGNFTDGTAADLALFADPNNAAPPVAETLALRGERMWYDDTSNPTRAYMSDTANPKNVPRVNVFDDAASAAEGGFFEVGKNDKESIVAFVPSDRLLVLKDHSTHYTDADNMREVLAQGGAHILSGLVGCRGKRTVAFGHFGVYWLAHDGVVWTDGRSAPVPVSLQVAPRFVSLDPASKTATVALLQDAHAVYANGVYLLFYKNTGFEATDTAKALVLDTRRVGGSPFNAPWMEWTFREASEPAGPRNCTASALEVTSDGQEKVYLGFDDGRVYLLDETTNTRDLFAAATSGIAWQYRSALRDLGDGSRTHRCVGFQVVGDFGGTNETITVKILNAAGTVLNGSGSGQTITVSGAGESEVILFDNTVAARQVYMDLSGTRITSANQDFLIREWRLWYYDSRGATA